MASLKIGAAWWKQDRNGQDYLSVSFDPACPVLIAPGQRGALFPNPDKTQPNQPDFELVVLPSDRPRQDDEFSPDQAPRGYTQPAPAAAPRRSAPIAPEDVPHQAPPTRRPAAPPPTRQAPPVRQGAAAGRYRTPSPPPDYDPAEGLDDPFAE